MAAIRSWDCRKSRGIVAGESDRCTYSIKIRVIAGPENYEGTVRVVFDRCFIENTYVLFVRETCRERTEVRLVSCESASVIINRTNK